MLSEITTDVAANKFDYHLRPATTSEQQRQQQQLQQQQPQLLYRSCSGYDIAHKQQQRNATQKDLLSGAPSSDRLLSTNADNLSWTFFDQVSSVDNHLRFDETDVTHCPSDGEHLTTTIVNDLNSKVYDGLAFGDERQHPIPHPPTVANISNGLTTKKKLAVDIVSEQSPGLLLPQSQSQQHQHQQQQQQQRKQQHKRSNSTVTTTTKFEQNPVIQPVHPKQYNNNNQRGLVGSKNNNYNSSNKENNNNNSLESSNITRDYHHPEHHQQHHHHRTSNTESDFQNHDPTTAMITGAFEADTEATGSSTTPRATRIRHLPAITKLTPVYAEGVDLVGDANPSTRRQTLREREHRSHPSSLKRMGATTKSNLASHSFVEGIETQLGLIGWRKKCLYILLVLLMLLIIVNLALTLWILKVMEFTTEGMGQLKILPGGIQLTGQAIILDMLRASTIRSRHGQPISIESSRNFSINTRDTNGVLENHLFLGHDKLECLATGFRINDTTGRNLFSVNRDEVTIGAHALRIDGEGGAIFRESIQTPHVRAEPGRELRLESPTRQLELTAAKDMNLQSRAGGIEITALEDVKLSALDGSLRLESSKILMPNLRTAQPALPGAAQNRDHLHRVFQLCACANGKLFLAAPHSICAGDDSTVCR